MHTLKNSCLHANQVLPFYERTIVTFGQNKSLRDKEFFHKYRAYF